MSGRMNLPSSRAGYDRIPLLLPITSKYFLAYILFYSILLATYVFQEILQYRRQCGLF